MTRAGFYSVRISDIDCLAARNNCLKIFSFIIPHKLKVSEKWCKMKTLHFVKESTNCSQIKCFFYPPRSEECFNFEKKPK